jgi:Fe-S-cluster containining protein
MQKILTKGGAADVPCGGCVGCCSSSKFIHIGPKEKRTLSRIPKNFLFPAPLLPKGTMLLGYDAKGRCPMLADGKCSIYQDRPRTCRIYDCRVFAAAGVKPEDDGKGLIRKQARRWRFTYPEKRDRDLHAAVKAAARFIQSHPLCFPEGKAPSAARIAVLAVKAYEVFVRCRESSAKAAPPTEKNAAGAIVEALKNISDKMR